MNGFAFPEMPDALVRCIGLLVADLGKATLKRQEPRAKLS